MIYMSLWRMCLYHADVCVRCGLTLTQRERIDIYVCACVEYFFANCAFTHHIYDGIPAVATVALPS